MATASYQSNNDYNLVKDIRPFDMPYEATMKEIATKTQYWKVGADRVKSAYDQAVGLNPQMAQNKEYLKGFMSEATKNLDKITKSDLSVIENSGQATNVFKPLFDASNPFNARLLKDDSIYNHYQKQHQISNTFRTKDGGKEWNINNEMYYRDAEQKYLEDAQAGNIESIDSHFQNQKSFVPYYDYKKEITDIQEACKGFTSDTQKPIGESGYFDVSHQSGCDPVRLAAAYKTSLSDRAKQQMNIDGYAHFKGNEDVLLRKYKEISVDNAGKNVTEIKAAIAGLKVGKVTKEIQQKINDYQALLDIREPAYKKSLETWNDMTKGNPIEFVKNNYERLAGQLYTDDLTEQLGEIYRTDDIKRKTTPDANAMQKRKINADFTTNMINNAHDVEMARINSGYKKEEIALKATLDYQQALAEGKVISPIVGKPIEGVTQGDVNIPEVTEREFIETKVTPLRTATDNSYNELVSFVETNYGPQDGSVYSMAGLEKFLSEHNSKDPASQDRLLAEKYKIFTEANKNWSLEINKVRAIDAKIKREHPTLFDYKGLSDKKENFTAVIDNQKIQLPSISEKDMHDILSGENVNGYTMKTIYNSDHQWIQHQIFYNGKLIDTNHSGNDALNKFSGSVWQKNVSNLSEINKLKTGLYTTKFYNEGDFTHAETFIVKDKTPVDNAIKTYLGVIGGQNEKNGYRIVARSKTGEDVYVVPLDDKGKNDISSEPTDEILANIKSNDVNAGKVKTPSGWAYKIPNVASRYPGLPNDYDLYNEQKSNDQIMDLKTIMEGAPEMKYNIDANGKKIATNWKDSYELPGGTIEMTTKTGKTAMVSVVQGTGSGLTYAARIGDIRIEANTPLELKNLLKQY